MPIACKICIMERGLEGSDIPNLPKNEEEFIDHLGRVHHIPVRMPGESAEECDRRFLEKHPEAKICPKCIAAGAPWTK